MSGFPSLSNFSVQLAINDINQMQDADAVNDLSNELGMRSHIRDHKVFWNERQSGVIVHVRVEGLNADSTGKQVAEEIFEIACALLNDIDDISVEILKVS